MSLVKQLTNRFVDTTNPRSASSKARRLRWNTFLEVFPDLAEMRVLDLGGTPYYWSSAPRRPVAVTTVNLERFDEVEPFVTSVQGDACDPPKQVLREQFDLVVSNSLLEHVGGHIQRERLAAVVYGVASRHWVQTPYRYFPIEPHWLCPGIQFLPFEARVRLTMAWPLGHQNTSDREKAMSYVHEIDLIGITQMRSYFSSSTLWIERAAGLPKSLVAYRQ